MFLQLMVAQMKYQDPMNPTDTSTMLTQNATFTEVQAIQEMQSEMGMVLSSQLAFGSAAMIGKTVSWVDANGTTQSGTVDGATFTTSGPVVNVGDQQVAVSSIASVSAGSGSGSGSSSSSSGSTNS
jgi:flagellar basal-body rod modification protein FlgD